jgi:probable F420-dependent oxidoreductase
MTPVGRPARTVGLGVILPQQGLADASEISQYCRAAEDLGYARITLYDHILGVDKARHPSFAAQYDVDSPFHEPFVLLGYLAAVTTAIELVTGVVVLPQRQTAVVAKQAAEVDLLSGGRLILGVGVGYNEPESRALGTDFATRGARMDEQLELLRALWSQRSVSHDGRFETVVGLGMAPRPSGPIPIWLGARSDAAYRRVGRMGDGWFPRVSPGPGFESALRIVADAAVDANRDPAAIAMDCRLAWRGDLRALAERAGQWMQYRPAYLSLDVTSAGLTSLKGHLEVLATVARGLKSLAS